MAELNVGLMADTVRSPADGDRQQSLHSCHRAASNLIDARHSLNDNGVTAFEKGLARKIADFVTAVVAHASDFDRPEEAPGPACFKCRKRDDRRVETSMAHDEIVTWHCPAYGTHGRISGTQGTFWDRSQGSRPD